MKTEIVIQSPCMWPCQTAARIAEVQVVSQRQVGAVRERDLTTEDTEAHRDSQRKAEKKGVAGGNLRVVRRKRERQR
jgi:hypothetical protein